MRITDDTTFNIAVLKEVFVVGEINKFFRLLLSAFENIDGDIPEIPSKDAIEGLSTTRHLPIPLESPAQSLKCHLGEYRFNPRAHNEEVFASRAWRINVGSEQAGGKAVIQDLIVILLSLDTGLASRREVINDALDSVRYALRIGKAAFKDNPVETSILFVMEQSLFATDKNLSMEMAETIRKRIQNAEKDSYEAFFKGSDIKVCGITNFNMEESADCDAVLGALQACVVDRVGQVAKSRNFQYTNTTFPNNYFVQKPLATIKAFITSEEKRPEESSLDFQVLRNQLIDPLNEYGRYTFSKDLLDETLGESLGEFVSHYIGQLARKNHSQSQDASRDLSLAWLAVATGKDSTHYNDTLLNIAELYQQANSIIGFMLLQNYMSQSHDEKLQPRVTAARDHYLPKYLTDEEKRVREKELIKQQKVAYKYFFRKGGDHLPYCELVKVCESDSGISARAAVQVGTFAGPADGKIPAAAAPAKAGGAHEPRSP